jgi:hypothetical protein
LCGPGRWTPWLRHPPDTSRTVPVPGRHMAPVPGRQSVPVRGRHSVPVRGRQSVPVRGRQSSAAGVHQAPVAVDPHRDRLSERAWPPWGSSWAARRARQGCSSSLRSGRSTLDALDSTAPRRDQGGQAPFLRPRPDGLASSVVACSPAPLARADGWPAFAHPPLAAFAGPRNSGGASCSPVESAIRERKEGSVRTFSTESRGGFAAAGPAGGPGGPSSARPTGHGVHPAQCCRARNGEARRLRLDVVTCWLAPIHHDWPSSTVPSQTSAWVARSRSETRTPVTLSERSCSGSCETRPQWSRAGYAR